MIEKEIYLAAIEKPKERRPNFLQAVCGASDELRSQVDFLISTHQNFEGKCDGETISLVLTCHDRELLPNRNEYVLPLFHRLGEETPKDERGRR
tara:strand:+ start:333 stop:614 length:282 start_codon:yes stop_codon:yes gene_type:complete